jgi:hypothetical protein
MQTACSSRYQRVQHATSVGFVGAAIANTAGVEMPLWSPKVDLIHSAEPDEWCVTVDGERVLSFSGPSAWSKALSHKAELNDLLARGPGDEPHAD